jgi:transglutaminase-like putative cysteine protease
VLAIAARCAATCGALARLARRDGACDLDAAACALAAAQAVPYVPDPPGEWFQPVAYTLAHGGDCEDLAALVVALARALGLPARVVWMEEDPRLPLNHVSAQIFARGVWLWAEATVPGARLGEEPHAAVARTGRAVAGLSAA